MSKALDKVIDNMPMLLDRLLDTALLTRANLLGVPDRGIYVFYEDEVPIYVGRSKRLRQRLLQHGRPSSRHNSATFAFNLAIEAADDSGISIQGKTRAELEKQPSFAKLYTKQKMRVAAMQVRVIEVIDPIEQAIFEVYSALAFRTSYNDFDTH